MQKSQIVMLRIVTFSIHEILTFPAPDSTRRSEKTIVISLISPVKTFGGVKCFHRCKLELVKICLHKGLQEQTLFIWEQCLITSRWFWISGD